MERKNVVWLCAALIAVAGCDSGTGEERPDPVTTGNLESVNYDYSASGELLTAFGFATNGTGLVYLSPNENATCATVTEYLNEGGSYDPVDILRAGHCSVVFRFNYGDTFDGQVHTDDDVGTFANVNCAMGDGTWTLVGSGRDRGYQFTSEDGSWWQGSAGDFTVTTTAGADENTPDVDLNLGPTFNGQFIYDFPFDQNPATGSIAGQVTVERCQSLTQTQPWN